jgi:hypothetical protein
MRALVAGARTNASIAWLRRQLDLVDFAIWWAFGEGGAMRRILVVAAAFSLGLTGVAFAEHGASGSTPAGGASAGGGRPDFAGQPDVARSSSNGAGDHANSNSQSSGGGAPGYAPGSSNAGGQGLEHAAGQAQPTLQAINQAFSDQEISEIRAYFTARAQQHKPSATTSEFRKGQQLPASADAQPLSSDLLAQLPSRSGLTYAQVGDTILLLAGPNDVIVDIIPNASGGG